MHPDAGAKVLNQQETIMRSTLETRRTMPDMDAGVAAAATTLVTLGGGMSLSLLVALAWRLVF